METITKYNDSSLKIETPEVKVNVLSLDTIVAERNAWIQSKANAEAQIAYYDSLLTEATKFDLKTAAQIAEEAVTVRLIGPVIEEPIIEE